MATKPAPVIPSKVSKAVDAWKNVLTLMGTFRDKRRAAEFMLEPLAEEECEELYAGAGLTARAVDLPGNMMLRNGVQVLLPNLEPGDGESMVDPPIDEERSDAADEATSEAQEKLAAVLEELELIPTCMEAMSWSRALGGCATLIGVDDGRDLEKPVDAAAIKGVRYLLNLRPRECWPVKWGRDPKKKGYGKPLVYMVRREADGNVGTSIGFKVHASRIVRWEGIKVPRRLSSSKRGWGLSFLERWRASFRDFESSFATIPILLQDFSQAVHKMAGLAEALAGDEDELVAKRIQQVEIGRSILRAVVVDKDDEFERQETPVSGLADLLDRMCKKLAADVEIPPALLFGEDPGGLNATGSPNVRWYYDALASMRLITLKPKICQIVRLVLLAQEGPTDGVEPERWSLSFGEMWLPTPDEEAQRRKTVAEADQIYLSNQVVTPEEIALSRFGGDQWSAETHLDLESRAQGQTPAEMELDRQKQLLEAKKPAPGEEPPPGSAADPTGGANA